MEQLSLINTTKDKKKLTKFQEYLLYFFVFSFIGWVLETLYSYLVLGHFTNRGFFYGPICPIYGCSGIMLLTFLGKKKGAPIQFFFISVIVLSIFEYAIGYGLDALYNIELWDYNSEFFNINGRVCLLYSLMWGVISIIFVYLLMPAFKKLNKKVLSHIPTNFQLICIRVFSFIFIIDMFYSFIEYSHIHG